MATPVMLTPHQCDAVSWLLEQLVDGVPLIALRGYAGTGKTSIMPNLVSLLDDHGIPSTIAAPTHRAATILKRKGLETATTVHSAALTSYFTPDFAQAVKWLGESCPVKIGAELPMPDVEGVPWLIHDKLAGQPVKATTVQRRARQYGAKKALGSIGISGKDHFAGFGPKLGEGCLIVDEASMVGKDMLELCCKAFPLICLVGDPGQLPPVKDGSCLADVPGFQLTELHRQAADSPIIRLAYAAREGQPFWERLPLVKGQIDEWRSVEPQAFLESPLLVWRNTTRLECTKLIRQGLGYPEGEVQVGEPLVCRSTDPVDRADGLYNNALFRIVEVSKEHPRLVTVQADCSDETKELLLHMEELHGTNIDPEAVPFRYGYALTCHTAQGGEWPTVFISKPDLYAYAGFCQRKESAELPRWAYTAITRAKQTLGFLAKHDFTRAVAVVVPQWGQGATTMPKMKQEPESAQVQPDALGGGLPHVDDVPDIPDPVVPPGTIDVPPVATSNTTSSAASVPPSTVPPVPDTLLPLAHGFCQFVQAKLEGQLKDAGIKMSRDVETVVNEMATFSKGVLAANEHAHYSFADALAKITAKPDLPYTATVTATSADGFGLTLTIQKPDSGELVEEIGRLLPWLKGQGFTAAVLDWAA